MNRNAVRILACILSLIFTGFYYLVFNHQFAKEEVLTDSDLIKESSEIKFEEQEIYWLQLGIFSESGSVNVLIEKCARIGIECHTYTKNESIIAFCNPTTDSTALSDVKKLLSENELEYYQKSAVISDPSQLEKLNTNSKEAYLEVISSLP